ncbi:MAG TPA: class I SAM-dependent methyltransferase, partial [Nitrospiria bacterium]
MNPTGDLTLDTLRIYEEEYQSFLDRWGKGAYVPPPLLLEFIEGLPAQSTILDLACGPGQDTRFLRREGFKAVGLDLSSRLLEWAREQSSQTPLIRADMRRLPLQKNRFDAVWSAAGLVHLTKADFGSLLKAIRLTMRTGGRFGGTFTFGTRSGPLKGSWLPG